MRGARVGRPLGLSLPGTRGVARASGSALPLRESSLARRPRFEKKTSLRLPDCRCGAEKKLETKRFRDASNETTPVTSTHVRYETRHTARARAGPPADPRISTPPFRLHHDVVPRRSRPRSPRGPGAFHEHGPPDQVLRGVALQRLAGYVSRASRASGRTETLTLASPAHRQEPGARGCSPSPRTTTTSTPKKRSTCEDFLARTRRSRPRRGSETTHETTHDVSHRRECLFSFFSFALEDARHPTFRPPLRGPCPT